MKYLNLFLIFTIFTCYSGLHNYVLNSSGLDKSVQPQCHHNNKSLINTINDIQTIKFADNTKKTQNVACCIKSYIKSPYKPDDRKVSFYKLSIDNIRNNNTVFVLANPAEDNPAFYIPPDLFLFNSTLLI